MMLEIKGLLISLLGFIYCWLMQIYTDYYMTGYASGKGETNPALPLVAQLRGKV